MPLIAKKVEILITIEFESIFLQHNLNLFNLLSQKSIYILGIESSCDDTSASVIYNGKVLSNVVANQEIHAKYGGVVPELASRAHQQNIVPVVQQALEQANIDKSQLSAITFTRGPGLMGSLLVGTSFAKGFGLWGTLDKRIALPSRLGPNRTVLPSSVPYAAVYASKNSSSFSSFSSICEGRTLALALLPEDSSKEDVFSLHSFQ